VAAVEAPVAASNGAEASPPAAKKAKRGAARKTGAKRAAKPKAAE
jgi:hypothetical protein